MRHNHFPYIVLILIFTANNAFGQDGDDQNLKHKLELEHGERHDDDGFWGGWPLWGHRSHHTTNNSHTSSSFDIDFGLALSFPRADFGFGLGIGLYDLKIDSLGKKWGWYGELKFIGAFLGGDIYDRAEYLDLDNTTQIGYAYKSTLFNLGLSYDLAPQLSLLGGFGFAHKSGYSEWVDNDRIIAYGDNYFIPNSADEENSLNVNLGLKGKISDHLGLLVSFDTAPSIVSLSITIGD